MSLRSPPGLGVRRRSSAESPLSRSACKASLDIRSLRAQRKAVITLRFITALQDAVAFSHAQVRFKALFQQTKHYRRRFLSNGKYFAEIFLRFLQLFAFGLGRF